MTGSEQPDRLADGLVVAGHREAEPLLRMGTGGLVRAYAEAWNEWDGLQWDLAAGDGMPDSLSE